MSTIAQVKDQVNRIWYASFQTDKRLQLTAFGARDRWYLDSFCNASAAAEAQAVRRQPLTPVPSFKVV